MGFFAYSSMKIGKPPSKPRRVRRKGSNRFSGLYWEDRLDDSGQVIGRRQVQVALFDEDQQRITTPRKADAACDRLYEQLVAAWRNQGREPMSAGAAIGGMERSGANSIDAALDRTCDASRVEPERATASSTAIAAYRDSYLSTVPKRTGTRRSYETKLTQFCEYLQREHGVQAFSALRREHIKQFLSDRLKEVKPVTVHGDLRAIRAFLNEAVRDEQIAKNPCTRIKLPSLQGAHASEGFFLPSEMDAIVAHCEQHESSWFPIFAGFRYAPFRREELCYLEWSDLDFDRDTIVIQDEKSSYGWKPKRDGRTMDLHLRLKQILATQKHMNAFVFNHADGVAYQSLAAQRRELGRRAWRKIKSLCDALELSAKDETRSWKRRFPSGPHLKAFRSGVSAELQLKGAPLAYVQNQLGHHDQSMTLEHYSHLVPELMGSLTKRFMGYLGSDAAPNADRIGKP